MSELRIVNETCIGVNNIHWTNIDPIIVREIKKLLEEKKQLKSVLNEAREIIETKFLETELYRGELVCISVENYKKVKTILDKVGELNES